MDVLTDRLKDVYAEVKDLLVSDPNNKVALDNKIAELETIKAELLKAEFSSEYIKEVTNSINSVSSVLDCYVKSSAARTQNTCSANDLKNSIDNATNAGTCQNTYKGNSEVFDSNGRIAAEGNIQYTWI